MKSKPYKNIWGRQKTRMELLSLRLDKAIRRTDERSHMSNRFFDMKLARFHKSWSK